VIVEGGAQLLNAFLEAGIWDEIRQFVNPKIAGPKSLPAPQTPALKDTSTMKLGDDDLLIGFRNQQFRIQNPEFRIQNS
jgi:diaminohydroxyphosphoribosylaminopyrimidine deaminase/5-amino-6-(5-phosphoribosylamino)uracil reductase